MHSIQWFLLSSFTKSRTNSSSNRHSGHAYERLIHLTDPSLGDEKKMEQEIIDPVKIRNPIYP